jgi:methionine synthase II (cobalamin-independent)
MTDRSQHPIVHFVGSIPLPDSETVFRTLSKATGPYLTRLPDGETGIRKTWIRFLQDVLSGNSALEFAKDAPPFKFVQWDGKLVREIPRLRVKPGATIDPNTFQTGYADMAIESWKIFERLQKAGEIPANVKFQISIPTPIAPTYNNMVPSDRPKLLPALTEHFAGEVAKIAQALPNDRIALQWDVCQEVLAWEGYYEPGPVDVRVETVDVLAKVGDAVPAAIELGYHLCYGSPADEHMVQPKDAGIMVEIANAVSARVRRPIQFFHMPVPKGRSDDGYFAPLEKLHLGEGTELYLGLIHHDDAQGDAARLAAARRHVRVDGIGTECGMARGDPARLPALLAAHARAAKLPA